MIYRWHAAISNQDEAWANAFMKDLFGQDVDPSTLSVTEFLRGLGKWSANLDKEPSRWTFGTLERLPTGSFKDSDLVKILQDGTEHVAGAFGARNTPQVLKAIEMLGIQQGRDWGLATLNELRSYFKLKPYTTFEAVNSDPAIAEALEALYGHPDNIELYVGVQAEESKVPFSPGSGLCPGFTISVAILSDAVALVRGDRFYTVDYGPVNLTTFGFKESNSDFDVANGGAMYKLLMRAFPRYYAPNSVYALYPFTTPQQVRESFGKQAASGDLDYNVPSFQGPWAQLIDLYLSDKYYVHWPDIQRLARSNDAESFEKLKKYALEGFRLSTPAFGVLREVTKDSTIEDGVEQVNLKRGDTLFVDFVTAGRDIAKFPDPESIRLDRPDDLYIHHGWGPHSCLGRPVVTVAAAAMLRVVARLDNFRRAPGPVGEMKNKVVAPGFKVYLPEDGSEWTPFPCNKKALFDSI
ncbi:hypothetical protein ATERTT37_002442 [Aspergillus terreus]